MKISEIDSDEYDDKVTWNSGYINTYRIDDTPSGEPVYVRMFSPNFDDADNRSDVKAIINKLKE